MSKVIDPYENVMNKMRSQFTSTHDNPSHEMIVYEVAKEMAEWIGVDMNKEGYAWATWICEEEIGGSVKNVMERTLEKIENEFGVFPENGKSNDLLMQKFHQLILEKNKSDA